MQEIIDRWARRGLALLAVIGALSSVTIPGGWAEESSKDGSQPGTYFLHAENLRLLTSLSNVEAKCQLAELYERGLGVPQNFTKAIRLYREAALNGCAPARRRLASLGVSLFAPEPVASLPADVGSHTDGQPLRLAPSQAGRVAAEDQSIFASGQSIFSHRRFIVPRPARGKPRLGKPGDRDIFMGSPARRIRHGAVGPKAQRKRPVGPARSGATGLRIQ